MKHDTDFKPARQDLATPAEVRAAIFSEICDDMERGEGAPIPVRIFSIVERALARANEGEFQ